MKGVDITYLFLPLTVGLVILDEQKKLIILFSSFPSILVARSKAEEFIICQILSGTSLQISSLLPTCNLRNPIFAKSSGCKPQILLIPLVKTPTVVKLLREQALISDRTLAKSLERNP